MSQQVILKATGQTSADAELNRSWLSEKARERSLESSRKVHEAVERNSFNTVINRNTLQPIPQGLGNIFASTQHVYRTQNSDVCQTYMPALLSQAKQTPVQSSTHQLPNRNMQQPLRPQQVLPNKLRPASILQSPQPAKQDPTASSSSPNHKPSYTNRLTRSDIYSNTTPLNPVVAQPMNQTAASTSSGNTSTRPVVAKRPEQPRPDDKEKKKISPQATINTTYKVSFSQQLSQFIVRCFSSLSEGATIQLW